MTIYTRMITAVSIILGLATLWLPTTAAQGASPLSGDRQTTIDDHIKQLMSDYGIPGLALGIVQGEEISYLQGYGIADSSGRAVTSQTPFLLASLSKSMTGVAIMQLVEAGKLELDAPVQRYLPWFQLADREAAARITIADLLYQRSGIGTYAGQADIFSGDQRETALEDGVRRLQNLTLNHIPGEEYEYSNTNYDILGLVVQTISGQPYEDYIQQHLFDPLDMRFAGSTTDFAEAQAEGLSSGYGRFFGRIIERETLFSRHNVASAGLIASAEDMTHYMIAQINGGLYEDARILSAEGMQQSHRPGIMTDDAGGYAMGWGSRPVLDAAERDDTRYSAPLMLVHQGGWLNFRSVIIIIPQHQLGVVVLMNTYDNFRDSAYFYPAYDTALLMLGIEPPPFALEDDVLTQNALLINGVVLLVMILLMVRSLSALRRWRCGLQPHGIRRVLAIILPLLWDIIVIVTYTLIIPQVFQSPLVNSFIFMPDYGLLTGLIVLIAAGWGVLRTVGFLRLWRARTIQIPHRH